MDRKLKLTQYMESRGGTFTARIGNERKYDLIRISRDRRYGGDLQKPEVSWFSGGGDSDDLEEMKNIASALMSAIVVVEMIVNSEALGREADVKLALRMTGLDADGLTVEKES